jgi:hypothetical protein
MQLPVTYQPSLLSKYKKDNHLHRLVWNACNITYIALLEGHKTDSEFSLHCSYRQWAASPLLVNARQDSRVNTERYEAVVSVHVCHDFIQLLAIISLMKISTLDLTETLHTHGSIFRSWKVCLSDPAEKGDNEERSGKVNKPFE